MLPSPTDPYLPLQEALKGRYALKCELGRGGMGIVYLADEVALGRLVALKLLPPAIAANPAFRERFLREARTSARLSHPGILPIYTVDQVGEFVFFTMAYVDGETLNDRVRSRGPLPAALATQVLRDVARAVAYAHAQGVIHRDLKADNILLEHGTGRALVMDFGIARVATQPDITGENEIVGTVPYMSPEQAQGLELDKRTDIYSLGVLGFFAATGRLPFLGGTAAEILEQHIHRPAPLLPAGEEELQKVLAQVVDRCLAKQPAQRFQTAGDLAKVLTQALEVRGDLPVPLRAFLQRLRYPPLLTAGLWLVGFGAVLWLAGALTLGHWGAVALAAGLLTLLLAAPIALVLPVTRRVLEAGHTHQDLVQALRDDVDRQHKTLAFQFGAGETRTERLARRAAYAGMGLFGLGGAAGMFLGGFALDAAMGAMVVGAFTAVGAGAVAANRHLRRRDVTGERWLGFWSSRLGEWVARLAGLGLRRLPAGAPPASGVATAFASAAERLLQDLPPELRERLKHLPDELRRLEQRTGGVQRWIDEMDTPLTLEGEAPRQDVVNARHAAERWLTASAAALEAIQRELQRLHEGTGTVEGVTAELEAAREIGEAVDRVLEGRGEVGDA